jgi:hypothetical protein
MFCLCLHSSVSNNQEEHKVLKYFVKKNAWTYSFYNFVLAAMFFNVKNKSTELSDREAVEEGHHPFIKSVNFIFLKETQILL